MDVRDAVSLAKSYIEDLFATENISNLGLEEVEFDDQSGIWSVTIGFSRPWDSPSNALAAIAQQLASPNRTYKIVSIDEVTGRIRSVKNREMKQWAESA